MSVTGTDQPRISSRLDLILTALSVVFTIGWASVASSGPARATLLQFFNNSLGVKVGQGAMSGLVWLAPLIWFGAIIIIGHLSVRRKPS